MVLLHLEYYAVLYTELRKGCCSQFRDWRFSGLLTIINWIKDGTVLDKSTMEERFGTEVSWFRYSQLKALITNLIRFKDLLLPLTLLEDVVWKGNNGEQGRISVVYKILLTAMNKNSLPYQQKWSVFKIYSFGI